MDLSNTPATPVVRHDGWTEQRKLAFLEHLAACGNVRAACARTGMSHEAVYRLRRRDPLFARSWAAALVLASEASADVLACRALDGIEEEIWFRGEVVGTRRRYDTRLLLAHMARLDKLAEDEQALEDAGRFDELLARVAGEQAPEELAVDGEDLPLDRETAGRMMAELADEEASDDDCREAYRDGRAEGEALWDAWFAGACDTVDRLLAEPLTAPAATGLRTPSTLSTVSTSAQTSPERGGDPCAAWGRGTLGES